MSRSYLLGPLTLYVHPDGNDDIGYGTIADPWRTWQHAYDRVQRDYDLRGYDVTIQANGPMTGALVADGPCVGGGRVFLTGSAWGSGQIIAARGAELNLRGFTLAVCPVVADQQATITLGDMVFGACPSAPHLEATNHGQIRCVGYPLAITGGAVSHLHCTSGGSMLFAAGGCWLYNTPTFSAYFAGVSGGQITFGEDWLYHGSAVGQRALIHKGGLVDTLRQGTPGHATYLPGDGPVVTQFGLSHGWYT